MGMSGVDFALPDANATRRAFDRAADRFETACVVHDLARSRLLERLPYLLSDPTLVVDLGAATGRASIALAGQYPAARVLSVDVSLGMLRVAQHAGAQTLAADLRRLPIVDGSADLVFANMVLPWCRPEFVFSETARILTDGGLMSFSTVGPDTLEQVRRAWAKIDDQVHVHAQFDMHDLGDVAAAAGLVEPVVDVDRMEVTYPDVLSMVKDLRACGAINVAAGRRRGLTTPRLWEAFEKALLAGRQADRFPVTVELVLGQAWGRGHRRRGPFAA